MRQGAIASSTMAVISVAWAFTKMALLASPALMAVAEISEVLADWRRRIHWGMGVMTTLFRASPKEKVRARRCGLGREGVAEITSITCGTVAASKYGRANGEFEGIVNTLAVGASGTRTWKAMC